LGIIGDNNGGGGGEEIDQLKREDREGFSDWGWVVCGRRNGTVERKKSRGEVWTQR